MTCVGEDSVLLHLLLFVCQFTQSLDLKRGWSKGVTVDHLNCIKDANFDLLQRPANTITEITMLVFFSSSWSLQLCSVKSLDMSRHTFV